MGDGSVENYHHPSSEGTFRVFQPETTPNSPVDRGLAPRVSGVPALGDGQGRFAGWTGAIATPVGLWSLGMVAVTVLVAVSITDTLPYKLVT
jgi:hypothetical protein